MNVKIGYTTHFNAAIWWDSRLIMSTFTATFKMITASDSPVNTNTALDRLKYMSEEYFVDTVFINHNETDQIKKLKSAGIKTVVMPEEPVDQIMGMMLYSKINAVMEGHMLIRSVLFSSTSGDEVIYEHTQNESVAPFDQPGWWKNPGPDCEESKKIKDQIFVLNTNTQWRDLGLEWVDINENNDGNVLVFTEFKNDKDK